MQMIMCVMAKPNQKSLRETVANDIAKCDRGDDLKLISKQTKGRKNGWAKIKRKGCAGALNLEWDADASALIARVVIRAGNKPDELIGAFVGYLLHVHGGRISSIFVRTLE